MVAEHVGTIVKRAWPIDGIPTGLPAHGYQDSPRLSIIFSPNSRQLSLRSLKRSRFLFASLSIMERTNEDNNEQTKTKRVYDERVVDKELFQTTEEADYNDMPDFGAGEIRFAPPDAVVPSSMRIEPPYLLDFRKKSLVPAQEIACQ